MHIVQIFELPEGMKLQQLQIDAGEVKNVPLKEQIEDDPENRKFPDQAALEAAVRKRPYFNPARAYYATHPWFAVVIEPPPPEAEA